MKVIKYKFLSCEINRGTEEEPKMEPVILEKRIICSDAVFEANLAIAKAEAYNGEYTIEDDGQPELNAQPTDQERIAALEGAVLDLLGVKADG